jgi:predicted nicotinamide N-methyase
VSDPRIHSTPPEAVTGRTRDKVFLDGRTFLIDRPTDSDRLFDHPAVRVAYAADDYVPYWADLWPAARMLSKAVLREPWPVTAGEQLHALEIACGLGLPGIVALACGLRVTFTDIDELALSFAAANARLNKLTNFDTAAIDLRSPPPGLCFDVILGADLLYEDRLVAPVAAFLAATLTPTGVALLADPDRVAAKAFGHECRLAGLTVERAFARAGEPGGERTKGTVYRIRRAVS